VPLVIHWKIGDQVIVKVESVSITDEHLESAYNVLPVEIRLPIVLRLLEISLAEDLSPDGFKSLSKVPYQADLTSGSTLPIEKKLNGRIFSKKEGIVAGLPVAEAIFKLVDPGIEFQYIINDGTRVRPGDTLARVYGSGTVLLAAERTALNFLGRMSGVASLTCKFVDEVTGTGAIILDTRKTIPGFRFLDKYAVRMGGGQNHRFGLYDMILIKNNHIDGAGGIKPAVNLVREKYGDLYPIEVEVRTLEELEAALSLLPSRIMLDNMDISIMSEAVRLTNGRVPLEASGNVTLTTARQIAETGVNYISVGALTHSATVLDISMHLDAS